MMSPILQAFIGTLFTYGMTAAGAAVVFFIPSNISYNSQRKVLDAALGFAGGVMIAASCFGLLIPSFTYAEESGIYGAHTWIPAVIGVMVGGAFVHGADKLIPHEAGDTVAVLAGESAHEEQHEHDVEAEKPLTAEVEAGKENGQAQEANPSPVKMHLEDGLSQVSLEMQEVSHPEGGNKTATPSIPITSSCTELEEKQPTSAAPSEALVVPRLQIVSDGSSISDRIVSSPSVVVPSSPVTDPVTGQTASEKRESWRRILLLLIAIFIHNFPEGLAVGVGFGALATTTHEPQSDSQTDVDLAQKRSDEEYNSAFADAKTLALAIGLQNFPEGLAVSLPLLRIGYSPCRAFFWGQLSGMVEPLGGLLGAGIISFMKPLLPYALSFAAGAMLFVVVHDILPETRAKGAYPMLSCWFIMIGFSLMMAMDVALG